MSIEVLIEKTSLRGSYLANLHIIIERAAGWRKEIFIIHVQDYRFFKGLILYICIFLAAPVRFLIISEYTLREQNLHKNSASVSIVFSPMFINKLQKNLCIKYLYIYASFVFHFIILTYYSVYTYRDKTRRAFATMKKIFMHFKDVLKVSSSDDNDNE